MFYDERDNDSSKMIKNCCPVVFSCNVFSRCIMVSPLHDDKI